jgi:hypothetical protein
MEDAVMVIMGQLDNGIWIIRGRRDYGVYDGQSDDQMSEN